MPTPLDFVRYINASFNIFELAKYYQTIPGDHRMGDVSCFCPFHDDESGQHVSARLYTETNSLYCFAESRSYRPYDFLKTLGGMTFQQMWNIYGGGFSHWFENTDHTVQARRLIGDNLQEEPKVERYMRNELPFGEVAKHFDRIIIPEE